MTDERQEEQPQQDPLKHCPFISNVFMIETKGDGKLFGGLSSPRPMPVAGNCMKEKCGIWDSHNGRCAILTLSVRCVLK